MERNGMKVKSWICGTLLFKVVLMSVDMTYEELDRKLFDLFEQYIELNLNAKRIGTIEEFLEIAKEKLVSEFEV